VLDTPDVWVLFAVDLTTNVKNDISTKFTVIHSTSRTINIQFVHSPQDRLGKKQVLLFSLSPPGNNVRGIQHVIVGFVVSHVEIDRRRWLVPWPLYTCRAACTRPTGRQKGGCIRFEIGQSTLEYLTTCRCLVTAPGSMRHIQQRDPGASKVREGTDDHPRNKNGTQ
jgi:hypothetical protein